MVLAGHAQQLQEDGDIIGFLRRAGHLNDGYVQGIIGPYPQVKTPYRFFLIKCIKMIVWFLLRFNSMI